MVPTHVSLVANQLARKISHSLLDVCLQVRASTVHQGASCVRQRPQRCSPALVPRAVFPVRTRGMHNQAALISVAVKESFSRQQREGKLIASTFRTNTRGVVSSPTADFKGSIIELGAW